MNLSYKNIAAIFALSIAMALVFASCAPYQAHKGTAYFKQRGKASWYGPGFAGRKTANGERFNPQKLTAAHRKLPFNTTVKVTNLSNDKSVVVRINDRGPYAGSRVIDLSKAAAKKIGLIKTGVAVVEIETVSPSGKKSKVAKKAKEAVPEQGVKLAARRVRKNGVEHLISLEKVQDEPLPQETVETVDVEEAAVEIEPGEEAEVATKTSNIEDSFTVSSTKPTKAPAKTAKSNTKPSPESYTVDEDDF